MGLSLNDIGTIAVIDLQSRALVESTEFVVPLPEAMAALGRLPDYQDAGLISWGHLTRDEAMRVMLREAGNTAQYLCEEADTLFAAGGAALRTLYYTRTIDGQ